MIRRQVSGSEKRSADGGSGGIRWCVFGGGRVGEKGKVSDRRGKKGKSGKFQLF